MNQPRVRMHARATITSLIERQRERQIRRLPTISELARLCGVSPMTVVRAVNELKAEGQLDSRQGRWIEITGPDDRPRPSPLIAERGWERVSRQIRDDIARGTYPPGTLLPSSKELHHRHGVCHKTLRAALHHCVGAGILRHENRRYAVTKPLSSSKGVILLITRGVAFAARTSVLVQSMESECIRAGVALRVCHYDFVDDPNVKAGLERELSVPGRIFLGFVIFAVGIPQDHVAWMTGRLSAFHKPVSILDETGDVASSYRPTGRLTKIFAMSCGSHTGEALGRFLISRSHRKAAYFSRDRTVVWTQQRFNGVRSAFHSAGLDDAVQLFGIEFPLYDETSAYARRAERVVNKMMRLVDGSLKKALQKDINGERGLYTLLRTKTGMIMSHRLMLPHYRSAAADPSITAWIGENDVLAIDCLEYLAGSGTTVPREVSVVGFDNHVDSARASLTTYDFNVPAYVRAMVMHVIDPSYMERIFTKDRTIEIDGFVVERGSTG
jgi:DNA-binding transcriptional regulator YhcF (GntR family)